MDTEKWWFFLFSCFLFPWYQIIHIANIFVMQTSCLGQWSTFCNIGTWPIDAISYYGIVQTSHRSLWFNSKMVPYCYKKTMKDRRWSSPLVTLLQAGTVSTDRTSQAHSSIFRLFFCVPRTFPFFLRLLNVRNFLWKCSDPRQEFLKSVQNGHDHYSYCVRPRIWD